jgi:hypothetical protein
VDGLPGPGERHAFLGTLVELLGDPQSSTSVVVALRADYVAAVAEHPELAALMADGTMLVGSPTPMEIERAITRPAARAGLVLEDGLAATMVDEAGNEPGLLPLLSVALTQVWEQRSGERLTYAGYVGVGGIAGAISTLAEGVWSELSIDEQSVARLLLLRLAGPGDGAELVRRRARSRRSKRCRSPASVVSWTALPRLACSRSGTLMSRWPTRRCSASGLGCRAG